MFNTEIFCKKISDLCRKKGTTVTTMTKFLGLGGSAGTNWKNGCVPNAATIKSISDYLNVSADYLISECEDVQHKPLTDPEVKLLELFRKLDENEQYKYYGRLEAYLETKAEFPGADG